jgi:hypothetical protein
LNERLIVKRTLKLYFLTQFKWEQLAVKDEYTFAFLDPEDEHSERELERGLTGRVEAFLREMGDMFAFAGSQYKAEVGERVVLYRSLALSPPASLLGGPRTKNREFEPEYTGKMQVYLTVLDEKVRLPDEQSSIGIILCKSRDRTVVEYALRQATPAHRSRRLPDHLLRSGGGARSIADPGQIAALLAGIDGER